jgi:hypothetical protein
MSLTKPDGSIYHRRFASLRLPKGSAQQIGLWQKEEEDRTDMEIALDGTLSEMS